MSCFVQVFGRVRPSASKYGQQALFEMDQNCIRCEGAGGKQCNVFELHGVIGQTASQEEVFECVAKNIVEECAEGVNGTIFAYGQTASGKTHTMLGPGDCWSHPDLKGIIPRSVEHLFNTLLRKADKCQRFKFTVKVQFVELYNEFIYDLLANSEKKICLRDSGSDVLLDGAEYETVDNYLDLMDVVKRGWEVRQTASTAMNRDSSRSHAILMIKIETQEESSSLLITRYSTLNLVDLAGSERQVHTKATGKRLKEATHINASLTVLGRCIRELCNSKHGFIPYRDSNLTHILKNSLGGNSRTSVIVNMHPDRKYLAESTSTLQFATACSKIKNKVFRNETMNAQQECAYKEAIKDLRRQLDEAERNARKTYMQKLDEAESKWRDIALETKSELDEMRAKYKMAVVRFSKDENDLTVTSAFGEKLVVSSCNLTMNEFVEDELIKKLEVANMEVLAKTKECEDLKKELAAAHSHESERLKNGLQFGHKRRTARKSSRNPRRETLYAPSPDRAVLNRVDSTPDTEELVEQYRTELQFALIEKEQFRFALRMCDLKLETVMQEMVQKEEEMSKAKIDSEMRHCKIDEKLAAANAQIKELEEKLEEGRGLMDSLLNRVTTYEALLDCEVQKHKCNEKKFNEKMTEMEQYYKETIANLTQEYNTLKEKRNHNRC